MNPFIKVFFTFVMYQPGPVILLGDLYLRGIITLDNEKSSFCLVMPTDDLVYTAHEALDIRLHINKDKIEIAKKNASNNAGVLRLLTHEKADVALFAKKYNFNNYVCNANTLVIVSQDSNSLYDSIQFIFDEQTETSHKISGEIDFEIDSCDLIVLGVKTIKIHLSERAFSSQGKPIPEIKPGGKIF